MTWRSVLESSRKRPEEPEPGDGAPPADLKCGKDFYAAYLSKVQKAKERVYQKFAWTYAL
ncbi:hypothetical protein [Nonomuraea sp. NPDC049480]|uniref:hypothetical protein n=1 Tax=Nonomuraea sp. NPDC049480 TaxID=3364353 RepID=UPI0037B9EF6A